MKWVITAAALMLPAQVLAETVCAATATTYGVLSEQFGEQRIGTGLMQGLLVEYWANTVTGTWSIVTTDPTGTSCLVASGDAFSYAGLRPNI